MAGIGVMFAWEEKSSSTSPRGHRFLPLLNRWRETLSLSVGTPKYKQVEEVLLLRLRPKVTEWPWQWDHRAKMIKARRRTKWSFLMVIKWSDLDKYHRSQEFQIKLRLLMKWVIWSKNHRTNRTMRSVSRAIDDTLKIWNTLNSNGSAVIPTLAGNGTTLNAWWLRMSMRNSQPRVTIMCGTVRRSALKPVGTTKISDMSGTIEIL